MSLVRASGLYLSNEGMLEILAEIGLITASAAGTTYIVSKVSTAIIKEITNWTGLLGWGVTDAIAISLSGLFVVAWALYCDYLYCQREKLA